MGWSGGTEPSEAAGRDQLEALLPYLHFALLGNPQVTDVLFITSGTSFELGLKTLFEPDADAVRALDLSAESTVMSMAKTTEKAEWTQGRLPLTYLGPDPALLDANGVFTGDPCPGD